MNTKKIVILDTNILIYDHKALFNFKNSIIVIPLSVIKELDKFKTDPSKGSGVRYINRVIDKLSDQTPVKTKIDNEEVDSYLIEKSDSVLIIEQNHIDALPTNFKDINMDSKILSVAYYYTKNFKNNKVIFYTNDIALRIQAKLLKIHSEGYEGFIDHQDLDEYTGHEDIKILSENEKNLLLDSNSIEVTELVSLKNKSHFENKYYYFEQIKLAFKVKKNNDKFFLQKVPKISTVFEVISSKNKEQWFALDALLDESIPLVVISGKAGTGKTLLALVAGIELLTKNRYKKLLVARPTISLPNNDIGFLPGDINDKMMPWLKPIYDNLDFIFGRKSEYMHFVDNKQIEVEPLAFIRGRSIPNQFIIIDEAQNLSPHEIKTIITRVGEGAKIILTGDPEQIDSPYLNSINNGLTRTIDLFKQNGKGLFAYIKLEKGERSELAELASRIFNAN